MGKRVENPSMTGAWSPEARAKRLRTLKKLHPNGVGGALKKKPEGAFVGTEEQRKKWRIDSQRRRDEKRAAKNGKDPRAPKQLEDGTYVTWTPEARAKRAAAIEARKNGTNGSNGHEVMNFPLELIPDRPAKRQYIKRQVISNFEVSTDRVQLASRFLTIMEKLLS